MVKKCHWNTFYLFYLCTYIFIIFSSKETSTENSCCDVSNM